MFDDMDETLYQTLPIVVHELFGHVFRNCVAVRSRKFQILPMSNDFCHVARRPLAPRFMLDHQDRFVHPLAGFHQTLDQRREFQHAPPGPPIFFAGEHQHKVNILGTYLSDKLCDVLGRSH